MCLTHVLRHVGYTCGLKTSFQIAVDYSTHSFLTRYCCSVDWTDGLNCKEVDLLAQLRGELKKGEDTLQRAIGVQIQHVPVLIAGVQLSSGW